MVAWVLVGRDPKAGAIVPLYEPQDNLSPAGMRFLERMGFDDKAFTAAILGLAAKGYLTITRDQHTYTLIRKPGYGAVESSFPPTRRRWPGSCFRAARLSVSPSTIPFCSRPRRR